MTYGNSTFVAVGQTGKILTSSDGANWTLAATVASGSLNAVTFSSALNLFIAVGNGGDIYTAASANLATWTKQTSSTTDTLSAVAVGVAGSTTTGDYVVMAGQVGVRDHVHIGDRAVLGAMAGVTNDVPADARMIGIPATPERDQKVKQAAFSKLPEMRRQLKQLERAVELLLK